MKRIVFAILLALVAGCGDGSQPESKSERALKISTGVITPTPEDYATLDVAPVSAPDGKIDVADVVVLQDQPQ